MPPTRRNKNEDPTTTLRTITSLLISDASLPVYVPTIVSLLYSSSVLESCNVLASASGINAQKRKPAGIEEDAGVLLHKFKTKVSSLLQSKIPQARWSGVALVKASLESSFECLASHAGIWIRLLVPLLAVRNDRPEPPATHKLIIATLTRAFVTLTTDKPTLTREIVVPNLPATIGHLLNLCSAPDSSPSIFSIEILASVLEALRDILQSHPVTFRPFSQKTHTLILSVLSSFPSSEEEKLAREIFVLLHLCASGSSRGTVLTDADSNPGLSGNKATAVADEWARGLRAVVQDTHSTLNVLFRSILEDSDYSRSGSFGGQAGERETTMEATGGSALGLADWKGIIEGVERVAMLLRLSQSFFALPSTSQVSIPIGQLIDLTTRIFSVTPSTTQINAAVERAERELVFARLPELHRNALDLVSTVVKRLGKLFAPFAFLVVEQIVYVFDESCWNAEVKTAVYYLLNSLLENFGTGLAKATAHSIHPILMITCDDLLPPLPPAATKNLPTARSGKQQRNTDRNNSVQNFHADAFLSILPAGGFALPGLTLAAETLLTTALAKLSTAHIRSELRTKMDRIAVLTGNTEAMLASVLFPPTGARRGGSILPHLVGSDSSKGLLVEGIVRPRLPVVWTGKSNGRDEDDEIENVEEEEEEEEEEEKESEEKSNELQEVVPLGSGKNPYAEETLTGESPYKRLKTELKSQANTMGEQMDSASTGEETKQKPNMFLRDPAAYARESAEASSKPAIQTIVAEVSASAAQVTSVSNVAAVSSLFTPTIVVSNTLTTKSAVVEREGDEVTKTTAFGVGGDSDDDMEIPEIVMGGSSSEEDEDDENEDEE